MTDEKEEAPVGYGRPPRQTQFKPGQSGNPAGLRRKSSKRAVGAEIGNARAEATTEQPMGTFEIMLRTLVHRALRNNDLAAVKEVLCLCEKYQVIKLPACMGNSMPHGEEN